MNRCFGDLHFLDGSTQAHVHDNEHRRKKRAAFGQAFVRSLHQQKTLGVYNSGGVCNRRDSHRPDNSTARRVYHKTCANSGKWRSSFQMFFLSNKP